MDLKQLRYYLEICSLRSFSKASKTLFVSQQGLSKSMRLLENELGTQLFKRLPTGIELTAGGEMLREHAISLITHHDRVVKQMQHSGPNHAQTLTIGYAAGSFDVMPPGFLSDYIRLHPDVDVRIKSFFSDQYNSAILNYKMDLSLCPVAYDTNLFDSLYSFKRKLVVLVSDDHPLAKMEALTLSDISKHKVGFLSTSDAFSNSMSSVLLKNGIKPTMLLTPPEMTLLGELTSRAGIIFFFAGRTDLLPGNIVCKRIEDMEMEWDYHFITNKNAYITQSARGFIDYARKRIEDSKEFFLHIGAT